MATVLVLHKTSCGVKGTTRQPGFVSWLRRCWVQLGGHRHVPGSSIGGAAVVVIPLPVEIGVLLAGPLVVAEPWAEFPLLTPANVQDVQSMFEALQHLLGVAGSSHPHSFPFFRWHSPQEMVHYLDDLGGNVQFWLYPPFGNAEQKIHLGSRGGCGMVSPVVELCHCIHRGQATVCKDFSF